MGEGKIDVLSLHLGFLYVAPHYLKYVHISLSKCWDLKEQNHTTKYNLLEIVVLNYLSFAIEMTY